MSEGQESPVVAAARKLPYKKWWFWLLLVLVLRVVQMNYESSRPVTYDPSALGFASEAEMKAAFAKGYHTRQKMDEVAKMNADATGQNSSGE